MQLVAQGLEGFPSGASVLDIGDAPLLDQGLLLTGGHHGEAGTLADDPRVMVSEAGRVGILACSNQSHSMVVDQVVQKLGQEFREPPHANEVTSGRVVLDLPGGVLALVELLLVVVTVALDDSKGDFF